MIFLICLLPLLLISIGKFLFPRKVTWVEYGISCTASVLMICIIYYSSMYSEMADTQVLSGYVTKKDTEIVHCRHSYECPPCYYTTTTTGTGKNRRTHRTKHCSTCYRHPFDKDWTVYSTLGNYDISKVDSQGLIEPKRWTVAYEKEPVAKTVMYTNYVKGAKDSLFNLKQYKNSKETFPVYPDDVYDLYRIDRVIADGVNLPDRKALNDGLSEVLSRIGAPKQVNMVLVFTNKNIERAFHLKDNWLQGRKNDLVVVIGTKSYPNIDWVEVFGWSKTSMVNVKLKSDIKDLQTVNPSTLFPVIEADVSKYYQRREMKEFEYLKDSIEPSTDTILWSLIIGLIISIGATVFSIKNDITE